MSGLSLGIYHCGQPDKERQRAAAVELLPTVRTRRSLVVHIQPELLHLRLKQVLSKILAGSKTQSPALFLIAGASSSRQAIASYS